jgi:hypothetical protein
MKAKKEVKNNGDNSNDNIRAEPDERIFLFHFFDLLMNILFLIFIEIHK